MHAGADLLLEAADPLHEELVEIGVHDRQELDPLEQRGARILGLVQDTSIEAEPGQLAIEVERRAPEIDRLLAARRSEAGAAGCGTLAVASLFGSWRCLGRIRKHRLPQAPASASAALAGSASRPRSISGDCFDISPPARSPGSPIGAGSNPIANSFPMSRDRRASVRLDDAARAPTTRHAAQAYPAPMRRKPAKSRLASRGSARHAIACVQQPRRSGLDILRVSSIRLMGSQSGEIDADLEPLPALPRSRS